MDEVAEAEKMRLLEQRISMFDAVTTGTTGSGPGRTDSVTTVNVGGAAGGDADSAQESDSESDSGSSSDSD